MSPETNRALNLAAVRAAALAQVEAEVQADRQVCCRHCLKNQ